MSFYEVDTIINRKLKDLVVQMKNFDCTILAIKKAKREKAEACSAQNTHLLRIWVLKHNLSFLILICANSF